MVYRSGSGELEELTIPLTRRPPRQPHASPFDGAGWLAFLRGLVARGLTGTALVISDAHHGLVDAVCSTLGSTWQRSLVHHPPQRVVSVLTISGWRDGPAGHPRRRERALAA